MALRARSKGVLGMMPIALEKVGSVCHRGRTSCRRPQVGLLGAGALLTMKILRDLTTAPRVEGPEEAPDFFISWLAYLPFGEGGARAHERALGPATPSRVGSTPRVAAQG